MPRVEGRADSGALPEGAAQLAGRQVPFNSESANLIMVHHIKENDVLLGNSHDQSPSKIKPSLMKGASMQSAKAKARVGMGITHKLG